jgi:hypothetical protein
MTVASEAAYAELNWTGAETSFSPGFVAERAVDVVVQYVDGASVEQTLVYGTHFTVVLDGSKQRHGDAAGVAVGLGGSPVTLLFSRVDASRAGHRFCQSRRVRQGCPTPRCSTAASSASRAT